MNPFLARLYVLSFLGIATGISINAVFLQETELAHFKGQGKEISVRHQQFAAQKPVSRSLVKASRQKDIRHVASVPKKGLLDAKIRDVLGTPDADLRPEPSSHSSVVKQLQERLLKLGYYPGKADGIAGPTTRAAIMAFEFDKGLPQTGVADKAILDVIAGRQRRPQRTVTARLLAKNSQELISALQIALTKLGYDTGGADGILGPLTRRRIRAFERDKKLEITGRISGRLVEAVTKARGKPLVLARL